MCCSFFLGLFVTKQNCFDALYWILLANLRYPSKSSCSSWVCKYESLHPIGSGTAYVSDGKSSDGEIPNVNPGSITPNWSPGGFINSPKGLLSLLDDTPLYSHMLYPYNFPADQSPCLLAFHPMKKEPRIFQPLFPWLSYDFFNVPMSFLGFSLDFLGFSSFSKVFLGFPTIFWVFPWIS